MLTIIHVEMHERIWTATRIMTRVDKHFTTRGSLTLPSVLRLASLNSKSFTLYEESLHDPPVSIHIWIRSTITGDRLNGDFMGPSRNYPSLLVHQFENVRIDPSRWR